jgi:hypothetical protein
MRLVSSLATIVVMATVGAAFAGDRPYGSPADSRSARSQTVIRPPASIPSSRANATAAPKTSSTDRHAAEFLRWKDQHADRLADNSRRVQAGDGRESQFILADVPKVKMASVNRDSA